MEKQPFYGKRLKLLRVMNNLTCQGLADKTGLSKQLISHLENSAREPSKAVEQGICKILGVSADFFRLKSVSFISLGNKIFIE